jgi:predicted DsbA family dithiol-disulfide isomerase
LAEWLERRFGVAVTWLPFDLHPEYPPEGMPRRRIRERTGDENDARLRGFFAQHDLVFNPPEVMPNSRAALRVTELARERGLHAAVHDRLMNAVWAEGRDIGAAGDLRELAVEAGLDAAEVDDLLAGDAYTDRVRASTAEAQSAGINAIPAFVLGGRLLVLGAQPREIFERAFEQLE